MATWEEIKSLVEENDNVLTISMNELKEAVGKDRLGIHVRSEISKTLAGMGLGHIPSELPSNQHDSVRLYKRGTPAGDLIEVVMAPSESNDRKLRDQLSGDQINYANIIEQIRELVAE
jgi:hypothetical protein